MQGWTRESDDRSGNLTRSPTTGQRTLEEENPTTSQRTSHGVQQGSEPYHENNGQQKSCICIQILKIKLNARKTVGNESRLGNNKERKSLQDACRMQFPTTSQRTPVESDDKGNPKFGAKTNVSRPRLHRDVAWSH